MPAHCCSPAPPFVDPVYRKILWGALGLNVAMFLVEIAASRASGSVALLADAIDFFGDAANYAVSLAVLPLSLAWRARASLIKSACMAAFGVFVLAWAGWSFSSGVKPDPLTMGIVAILALVVNLVVALMLYRYRGGDSNMRSVWICSRNDALGNLAVGLAALGVLGTQNGAPDLIVAAGMAILALTGAWSICKQAREELRGRVGADLP